MESEGEGGDGQRGEYRVRKGVVNLYALYTLRKENGSLGKEKERLPTQGKSVQSL